MTVQEAIKKEINECKRRIFRIKDFMENNKDANIDKCKDNIFVLETAIQALEGLEQYRALGTPTQILERIGGLDVELGKYHCLGTVEELKEAREKQVASKPYTESDGFADGVEVWEYFCPDCNFDFEEYQPKYCPKCGKKIDWSEEDD